MRAALLLRCAARFFAALASCCGSASFTLMTEPLGSVDTPERWAHVSKALLVISPFGAAFCYILAALQGAQPIHSLVIAAVMLAGCLGAALLFHLRGSKAAGDAVWIRLILQLLARR